MIDILVESADALAVDNQHLILFTSRQISLDALTPKPESFGARVDCRPDPEA